MKYTVMQRRIPLDTATLLAIEEARENGEPIAHYALGFPWLYRVSAEVSAHSMLHIWNIAREPDWVRDWVHCDHDFNAYNLDAPKFRMGDIIVSQEGTVVAASASAGAIVPVMTSAALSTLIAPLSTNVNDEATFAEFWCDNGDKPPLGPVTVPIDGMITDSIVRIAIFMLFAELWKMGTEGALDWMEQRGYTTE